ncbi:uncharacterized protein LOC144004212 [Festucalex cinctus]
MTRRCVAMYCSQAKEKLYEWPKDNRARKWTTFVRAKRMNFTPSSKSVLCYKHFEDACFLNQSAYDKGFAKKLLLNATAVPTIHLPPQDQQQIQNPPAQRAAAANRERKRAVAEAITSAAASEQEMADYEGQLLQDESCSNSEDDEVMPPHNVDKMMQTLKYCPPCEKCKKRANYRSIGIQCNLGQTEPKRKKACMSLVDTDSEEESDMERDGQHIPDQDVEYIAGEDSDEDEPSSSDDEVTHVSFEEILSSESEDLHKQRKYLVFESSLITLLAVCVLCKGRSTCYRYVKGTLVKIQAVCTVCGNKHQWCNQPFVRNLPVLNVLLSSAILFTGSLPSKALRIFRIILAAMHYNENAGRPQKVTKEGIHSYCIVYPKYKSGGYSLRKILVDATYDYVNDCLSEVMKLIDIPNKYRTGDVVVDPQFLTAAVNRPEKSNVIAEHHTRFLRK